jgi:hypothetical protein
MEEFKTTICELNSKGYKNVYIEKALDLPFGTISDLLAEKTELAPEDRALFRILRRFPKMIDVADNNYMPL